MDSFLYTLVSTIVMVAMGPVYIVMAIVAPTAAQNLVDEITNAIIPG